MLIEHNRCDHDVERERAATMTTRTPKRQQKPASPTPGPQGQNLSRRRVVSFDWMVFLRSHPLGVAASLLASGAAGGVAGYLAFHQYVETQVASEVTRQVQDYKLQFSSFRVGSKGVERAGYDPKYFEAGDGVSEVADSANAQLCAVSDIFIKQSAPESGCELHFVQPGSPWQITAHGSAKCRVTCFVVRSSN